jgi:hypothetical protein
VRYPKKPLKQVIAIQFPNKYELQMAFIRIFAYCDFPGTKGKLSLEDAMDVLADAKTYVSDFDGVCIPGQNLDHFLSRYDEGELRQREIQLVNMVVDFKEKTKLGSLPYAIIGYVHNCDFDHELAHAMYLLLPKYRKQCVDILRSYPDTKKLRKALTQIGYQKSQHHDEMNAYLATSSAKMMAEILGIKGSLADHPPLKTLFETTKSIFTA